MIFILKWIENLLSIQRGYIRKDQENEKGFGGSQVNEKMKSMVDFLQIYWMINLRFKFIKFSNSREVKVWAKFVNRF